MPNDAAVTELVGDSVAVSSRPIAAGGGRRLPNLDLIRAGAIIVVVIYHVTGMFQLAEPGGIGVQVLALGGHGVDLFFALSGFLIGGLYWSEAAQFGNVGVARFWARRAARTVPPYLIGLMLSYAAVRVMRNTPFDPIYLVFGQNYRE